MINDTSFWYLISFIIFVVIFSRPLIRLLAGLIATQQQKFAQRLEDAASFEAEQIRNLVSTEAKIHELPKEIQMINRLADEKINAYQIKCTRNIEVYKLHSFELLEQNIQSIKIDYQRHSIETALNTLTKLITSKLHDQVTPDIDSKIRHHLVNAFKI